MCLPRNRPVTEEPTWLRGHRSEFDVIAESLEASRQALGEATALTKAQELEERERADVKEFVGVGRRSGLDGANGLRLDP
jgi:hypothetical protein